MSETTACSIVAALNIYIEQDTSPTKCGTNVEHVRHSEFHKLDYRLT